MEGVILVRLDEHARVVEMTLFFRPLPGLTAQGVSELMAVGAPTEKLVDSVFVVYGVLGIAFAIGVLRESSGQRALPLSSPTAAT